MALIQGSQSKKNLNVELNLLPVFDVLSVCICFLLMTVVWIEVRSLETKQAFGSQSVAETKPEASIWMSIDERNNLTVSFKPLRGTETKTVIATRGGQIDFDSAKRAFQKAAEQKAGSTHIMPARTTKYEQVIRLMDLAKQAGIANIGLSPI